MTIESLKFIADTLSAAGIKYEFGVYTSAPEYPYFVGEYTEEIPQNEDGLNQSTFTLTGFSRDSWLTLEQAKDTIKAAFNNLTAILPSGSGVAVFYAQSNVIPTGDDELKRIDIQLTVKEWRVD